MATSLVMRYIWERRLEEVSSQGPLSKEQFQYYKGQFRIRVIECEAWARYEFRGAKSEVVIDNIIEELWKCYCKSGKNSTELKKDFS
jgi:hypothetical protein